MWSLTRSSLVCWGLAWAGACSASADMPPPHIASVAPSRGLAGTVVMVAGDHFCQRPGDSEDPLCPAVGSVEFGVAPGVTSMWSDAVITVEVPALAPGPVGVTVAVAGRISNSATFTVE
jgi:hypothetical protein